MQRKTREIHLPAGGWSRRRTTKVSVEASPAARELPLPEDLYDGLPDARFEARKPEPASPHSPPYQEQFSYRRLLQRRRQRELRGREEERHLRKSRTLAGLERGLLPDVHVPLRLSEGERACYASEAALCDEYAGGTAADLPVRDHGLLILTDRRLIYLGRCCQLLLSYEHLLRVSHLPGAVAFLADTWHRRTIFSLKNPLDCLSCLQLSLFHFQSHRE